VTDGYKPLFLNVFFVPVLLLMLEGCVSMLPVPTTPDEFSLRGKVAVRDGEERFSASILWLQRGNSFEIDLWGPLGQGRVQLVKNGEQLVLRNGQGETLTEGDAETVMRRHLGWSLPIDVLPAWVQGRTLAEVASEELIYGDKGELMTFRQLDWRVRLDHYRTLEGVAGSRYLPGRITAEKDTARLRLVITEWQI
jgi:outer membrane lipoprotein LolB